jgi:hypothetical protein
MRVAADKDKSAGSDRVVNTRTWFDIRTNDFHIVQTHIIVHSDIDLKVQDYIAHFFFARSEQYYWCFGTSRSQSSMHLGTHCTSVLNTTDTPGCQCYVMASTPPPTHLCLVYSVMCVNHNVSSRQSTVKVADNAGEHSWKK